jgi:hypothetical protein
MIMKQSQDVEIPTVDTNASINHEPSTSLVPLPTDIPVPDQPTENDSDMEDSLILPLQQDSIKSKGKIKKRYLMVDEHEHEHEREQIDLVDSDAKNDNDEYDLTFVAAEFGELDDIVEEKRNDNHNDNDNDNKNRYEMLTRNDFTCDISSFFCVCFAIARVLLLLPVPLFPICYVRLVLELHIILQTHYEVNEMNIQMYIHKYEITFIYSSFFFCLFFCCNKLRPWKDELVKQQNENMNKYHN